MITAGELKHRFKIEINTKTLDDQGGFNSEWSTLGYFWAKVDNKALKRTNTNGELIHTQDMTLHIRQKQRFDISPINSRDYRLTDKRGNMYSIVNFEQSNFALDFYAVSVVQAGHTNEPFAPVNDPCAGATQSLQILSLDGIYDFYIDDARVVAGGTLGQILETLLFGYGVKVTQDGVLTSYRDTVTSFRFERTDAGTIAFDALGNPTATLNGNTLQFCLSSGKWLGGVLLQEGGLLSDPDAQGFVTLSPDPVTCADQGAAFYLASQDVAVIQYRYPDLVPDNVHRVAEIGNGVGNGSLIFQNRATDGLVTVNWSLGSGSVQQITVPPPPVGTVITLQVDASSATVSYAGYSETLPHPAGFEPLQLPTFGFFVGVALARGLDESLTSCERQPMEIKF